MSSLVFADVGELGWSLYLSAHLNWLKKKTISNIAIITYLERSCLYRNLAEMFIPVCKPFIQKYSKFSQCGFGLFGVSHAEMVQALKPMIPKGYTLAPYLRFSCKKIDEKKLLYERYQPHGSIDTTSRILVFPRCRYTFCPQKEVSKHSNHFEERNLPKQFYIDLIETLCSEFSQYRITSFGKLPGAYNITEVDKANYDNYVTKDRDLQDLINYCEHAVAAVGGQSSLPKLSLLQGVPTFIIGHEENRHIRDENWTNTKAMFFKINKKAYPHLYASSCLDLITSFIRECV